MRWRPTKLALFVGLCSAGTWRNCADLRADGRRPRRLVRAAARRRPALCQHRSVFPTRPVVGQGRGRRPRGGRAAERQVAGKPVCHGPLVRAAGRERTAKQSYRALLKKAPQDARLHHRLGVLAVQKGDFAEAEEHFRAAKSLAPPTAELLSDIGYCSICNKSCRKRRARLTKP